MKDDAQGLAKLPLPSKAAGSKDGAQRRDDRISGHNSVFRFSDEDASPAKANRVVKGLHS